MTTFPIQLNSVSDIKLFVDAASRMDCDIDVLCGRYLVDGKSIMGLFSIDLSAPIEVEVHGSEAQCSLFQHSVEKLVKS
ncbi:MAG: HPr family phosphocarrier protein [Clostridia bacterium]|nr:HPr family phosphocarrier protein [Clostridia bacterium]